VDLLFNCGIVLLIEIIKKETQIMKKIYILIAYSDDGRIVDLGWSTSLNVIREAISSNEVKEQLAELTINTCEFK